MRRFAFLQCIRCRHFQPKRLMPHPTLAGPAFASDAYIGICQAGDRPEWIVWKSLDWAVSKVGSCPDRDPLPASRPNCPLYDFTTSSASEEYPKACVYHDTPACPQP